MDIKFCNNKSCIKGVITYEDETDHGTPYMRSYYCKECLIVKEALKKLEQHFYILPILPKLANINELFAVIPER